MANSKTNLYIGYLAFVQPHLEYAVSVWSLYSKKDITVLENIQKLASKLFSSLKQLSYLEKLEISNEK